MTWWDSIDTIRSINSKLALSVAIFGGFAGILALFAWFTSERLASLQDASDKAFRGRVQNAERTAAEAQAQSLALAEIQKPRTLSDDARRHMLDSLRTVPKGSVTVTAIMSNPEAENFASQIRDALIKAGWSVGGVNAVLMMPAPPGVLIRVVSLQSLPPHAVGIQNALKAAGIDAPGLANSKMKADDVDILVGFKPST